MHRKNLYLKLEMSLQSELFALFIEWLRKHWEFHLSKYQMWERD